MQRTVRHGTVVLVVGAVATVVVVVAPGSVVLVVAPGRVVLVVTSGMVVVVPGGAVVGVVHCERSTAHPAQRAQSGISAGVAVAASHTATLSPPTIGQDRKSVV